MSQMYRSKFLSTGGFVPPRVWSNHDISAMMDTSDEWIVQRTGIKQRHWVEKNVSTSDLAFEASKRALAQAGLEAKDLDMVILATITPDHEFPGTACFLQAKLGVPGIPALDVRQQCTGFIYGISIADQFVRTGTYKRILVVGAEVHSKGLDLTPRGRDVGVLFGDGAGATVIVRAEQDDDSMILSTHLHSDGSYAKELWVPAPGMGHDGIRLSSEMILNGDHFPKMNGKSVFVHATKRMPEAIHECLHANRVTPDQVDLFVFHQANLRINEMVAKQLSIPEDKVFNTIDRFANTTAATIPLGLDEAVKAGRLKKGMLVASAAFGSGFTWGSALYRW